MTLSKKITGKKILMIIAKKNFRDEEYFVPHEMFQKEGASVTTASSVKGEAVGVEGGEARSTMMLKEVNPKDFDAVVFIGGEGAKEYFENEEAHKIIQEFNSMRKIVAAICIAPVILAKSGILKVKKATVWSSLANKSGLKEFESAGCTFCDEGVVVDGNIVTADGPAKSEEFAKAVIEVLSRPADERK
jgi:protease I